MKKFSIIILFAGIPLNLYAWDSKIAAGNFKTKIDSAYFTDFTVNQDGNIINIKATELFISTDAKKQKEILMNICSGWNLEIKTEKPLLLSLHYANGGELYNCGKEKINILNQWSDERLYFGNENIRRGRFFGFIGGQLMSGGDFPATGFNLRLGTMLYKDKYDMAVTYDYNKMKDFDEPSKSFGLIFRSLMPLSEHSGWNLGAQMLYNDYSGFNDTVLGVVSGINIYLSQGSFDITFNYQEKGVFGFIMGYTIFIGGK
ncbi:MAG: hypothetical protein HY746_05795 [Elusimicrobia bacterium]|nr:hypothetical protein [Elusimicrobiota bacterium]